MIPVNNYFFSLLIALSATLFFSCGNKGTPPGNEPAAADQASVQTEHTTYGQFPYQHHIRTGGKRPYPGATVQYNYRLLKDGEEVGNSFGAATPPMTIMPNESEVEASPEPLIEGLRLMSEGDSITITTEGSSYSSYYEYEIVLLKVY